MRRLPCTLRYTGLAGTWQVQQEPALNYNHRALNYNQVQQEPGAPRGGGAGYVAPLERHPLPVQPPDGPGVMVAAQAAQHSSQVGHHARGAELPTECSLPATVRRLALVLSFLYS